MTGKKHDKREQRTIGNGWRQNQEAKLKIVGGAIQPATI